MDFTPDKCRTENAELNNILSAQNDIKCCYFRPNVQQATSVPKSSAYNLNHKPINPSTNPKLNPTDSTNPIPY